MSEPTAARPAADSNPLLSRRTVLRAGAAGVAALSAGAGKVLLTPSLTQRGLASPDGVFGTASIALADGARRGTAGAAAAGAGLSATPPAATRIQARYESGH
jgi:hypothetical protein